MSMEQSDIRALKREWTIGLAVVVCGFVLAIAVAAFLTFGQAQHAVIPDETQIAERPLPHEQQGGSPAQLCRTALANAKDFGVLPGAGRLTDSLPRPTDQQGRYICDAASGKAKYSLAVDIACKEVAKAQCVSLYSISQDDGSVLYQRQQ
ncbi:MAG TPA: hypothetical protein VGM36_03865 [Rhizomicrobium sp.]|jgi:hypothetical protein